MSTGDCSSCWSSVMVWGVCSWRDRGPPIRLETTLTGDKYVRILEGHLHPFVLIVHSDELWQFQRTMRQPTRRELLPSCSRSTLMNLGTTIAHLNSQTGTLFSISGILCNVLLRRGLHHLALLWHAGFMVSMAFGRLSDINRVHATSCCRPSACSCEPYTILGRCTNFSGTSVHDK